MSKIYFAFFIVFISICANAQKEKHVWKPLVINENQKVWYDQTQLDTINTARFSIWLLELHRPLLNLEGVSKNIMRTKSLYLINLEEYRYSLKEVVYYNQANVEIKRFSYTIEEYEEEVKYYFPITNNSIQQKIVDELLRIRKLRAAYNTD
ncbi:MAG: hypothetical protein KF721_06235 [Ignavibacteriaceae bacterium]|mgnify:CR=1 FL=1|nr:hypothetical protein [Ignavibacteriaceae bacterium]HRI47412.1 hypothetical protein [Ignavibacteriaceae bacterium]